MNCFLEPSRTRVLAVCRCRPPSKRRSESSRRSVLPRSRPGGRAGLKRHRETTAVTRCSPASTSDAARRGRADRRRPRSAPSFRGSSEFHVVRCTRDVAGGVLIGPPHLGAAWAAGGRSAASRSTRVPDSAGTGSAASALEKSREIVPQGLDGSLRLRGGTPAHAVVPSGLPEARAPLRRTSTPFSAR